jgi:hypothetical protein
MAEPTLDPLAGTGLFRGRVVWYFRSGLISDMLAGWAKRSNPTSRLLRCEPTTSMLEASRGESIGSLPAAAPEQALMLVLAAVPEDWTVSLSDAPAHDAIPSSLKLQPGEARLIR